MLLQIPRNVEEERRRGGAPEWQGGGGTAGEETRGDEGRREEKHGEGASLGKVRTWTDGTGLDSCPTRNRTQRVPITYLGTCLHIAQTTPPRYRLPNFPSHFHHSKYHQERETLESSACVCACACAPPACSTDWLTTSLPCPNQPGRLRPFLPCPVQSPSRRVERQRGREGGTAYAICTNPMGIRMAYYTLKHHQSHQPRPPSSQRAL